MQKMYVERPMPWQGLTSRSEIREDTLIYLFTQYRSRPVSVGMEIQIRTQDQTWLKIMVLQAGTDELDIQTPDGVRWRMTPMQPGEQAATNPPSTRAKAWVVRGRVGAELVKVR